MSVTERFGVGSMIAPLRRVLLKHARDASRDQEWIGASWQSLGYAAPPIAERAMTEYFDFVGLLRQEVAVLGPTCLTRPLLRSEVMS